MFIICTALIALTLTVICEPNAINIGRIKRVWVEIKQLGGLKQVFVNGYNCKCHDDGGPICEYCSKQ